MKTKQPICKVAGQRIGAVRYKAFLRTLRNERRSKRRRQTEQTEVEQIWAENESGHMSDHENTSS